MARPTRGKTTISTVHRARDLRAGQTPAERKLWAANRNRQLAGLKFRRQHPAGQFVLDAFCVEHQLEVEVDGGVHASAEQKAHDPSRTEYLEQHGIRVLRFTNDEVERNLADVLKAILEATMIQSHDSPSSDGRSGEPRERGAHLHRACGAAQAQVLHGAGV